MKPSIPSSPDVQAVLKRVRELLDSGLPSTALDLLGVSAKGSPALRNAAGVCLLRLGRIEEAVRVFREIVFPGRAFSIPDGMPAVFQANYVTALLLSGNLAAGIDLLAEIPDKDHPAVRRLKTAVRRWKRSLPWWRRLLLPIGLYPQGQFPMDFPAGALWCPETDDRPKPARSAA